MNVNVVKTVRLGKGRNRCMIADYCIDADSNKENDDIPPPLIIIGGTAQSIYSWESHVLALARSRRVMVYECEGQGPDKLGCKDVSLERQAAVFDEVVGLAFPNVTVVDVAGFSLGGRIGMAAAAEYPGKINKLHLTGVTAKRDAYARLILQQWLDLLGNCESTPNGLEAFAWSSIMSTYSPSFLARNERRVKYWVRFVCQNNTGEGLRSIIEQTHVEDMENLWHPIQLARRIRSRKGINSGKIAVGGMDHLCSVNGVQELQGILGWTADVKVFNECAHAVPMENPIEWRKDLVEFLDD